MKLKVGRRRININGTVILGFVIGVLLAVLIFRGIEYMNQRSSDVALPYRMAGVSAAWLPDTVTRWDSDINKIAQQYNIDANLVAIIMTIESGGYTRASSGVANGLMQVTEYTGGDIAKKFLLQPRTEYDLYDPQTSIEFGAAYLAYLRDTFCVPQDKLSDNECVELVAAGYNGGPGAAGRLYRGEGLIDMETVGYSRDAYNMWRELRAKNSPTYERWLGRGGQSLVDAAILEMR